MNKKTLLSVSFIIILYLIFFPGCKEKDKSERKEEILKVGATFPLSGDVASAGERIKNGLLLALDEVNNEGVETKKIEIVLEDDQNQPALAARNMKKFVEIDNVVSVIGSAASSCSLAMVPFASKKEVVMLSPISSSLLLSEKGGEYFFRICPADDAQAKIAGKWLIEKQVKSLAIIHVNNDWGKPLAESVKSMIEKNAGNVPLIEAIEEGETDFRAILTKIKSGNFDFIYAPTYPIDGGLLVKQAKELGISIDMLGGDNWSSQEFKSTAGNAINGCYFVSSIEVSGEIYNNFEKAYKSRYGNEPDNFATWAYDAMKVMALALRKTNGKGGVVLKDVLKKIDYNGASGRISFDENGDQLFPRFGIFKYEDNKTILIKGE